MSGGDIAGLIAAGVFAVLVGLLAVPLVKLGKVFDQTTESIKELSDNVTPLLEETTATVAQANRQLERVDTITGHVAEVTGNVNSLVALFAASLGGPLIKVAAFSAGVRNAILGDRQARRERRKAARPKTPGQSR